MSVGGGVTGEIMCVRVGEGDGGRRGGGGNVSVA